ncbi:MAG TPA: hypothetical protein VGM97_00230 [Steroidobacteraceae bacterium]|jgi:hypothetical protein
MTTVIAKQLFAALAVTAAALIAMSTARAAGPQIMMYITVPLDGHAHNHVFGLRLDKVAAPPDIRVMNPTSPLNRRPLLDLELGADSALRLDLDRKLTWDFSRQQWHQSSLPATFTVRLPTHPSPATHDAPVTALASAPLVEHSVLSASLLSALQNPSGLPGTPR